MTNLRLITLIIIFSVGILYGQTDQDVQEIIIEDNRLSIPVDDQARYIEVISKKELERLPVTSVAGLLQHIGAVDLRQRGANGVQADLSLRGSTFEQVLVMINGVKIIDPQTGHHIMNIPLDKDIIERIEIIKGPAARIYGQNAFAGAINIITKVPKKDQTKIGITTGTHDLFGAKVSFAKNTKKDKNNVYFSAGQERSDGYRPNTDYERTTAFLQYDFKWKKQKFSTFASYVDNAFGASSFYAAPFDSLSFERVKTAMAAVKTSRRIKKLNVKSNIYYRWNHDNYLFNRNNASLYENNHFTNVGGIDLGASTYVKDFLTIGFGIEGRLESIKSNNLGDHRRQVGSAFIDTRFHFLDDKLNIVPGAALHYYSDFGPQFYYGIDGSYRISNAFSVLANYGTTYRVPSYTELYYSDRSNIGNDELRPEFAATYELGLKYQTKLLQLQTSYFYRDGQDIIDWTRVTVQVDTMETLKWRPSNLTNLPIQGFDASLVLSVQSKWKLSPLRLIRASYTHLNGELHTENGLESRYALEFVENQFNLSSQWGILKILRINTGIRYLDRISVDDYWVLDLGFGLHLNRFTFDVVGSNVTNTIYEEYPGIQMPQNWWRFNIGYRL